LNFLSKIQDFFAQDLKSINKNVLAEYASADFLPKADFLSNQSDFPNFKSVQTVLILAVGSYLSD
jgi:hypothetical protein